MGSLKTKRLPVSMKNLETGEVGLRYLGLKNHLRRQILTGRLPQNGRVPSELELCRTYSLSRNTVQRAILDLVEEGFLMRHQGRGTFVRFRRSSEQQNLIGLMYPHDARWGNTPWERVIAGAQKCADLNGFHIVLLNTMNEPNRSWDFVARLNEMKAVGTLCIPISRSQSDAMNNEILAGLLNSGQEVVLMDTNVEGPNLGKVSCVTSENLEGSYAATKYLVSLGYRRIAFLRGPHRCSGDERFEGYLKAVREAGLEIRPEYTLKVGSEDVSEQGQQEVDVFAALRQPPEAVVCLHDTIAANVLRRCEERGLRVPENLAVVGFDDNPQAKLCRPPLTTVRQDLEGMGYRAMEILIGQIQQEITEPVIERLKCELIVRESTRKISD